jgi:hypothetical protein
MILSKTLQKPGQLMSVATKVGIQINAKLGGEIWTVQIPVGLFLFFICKKFFLILFEFIVENIDDRWY